jgi:Methyltransferase domain
VHRLRTLPEDLTNPQAVSTLANAMRAQAQPRERVSWLAAQAEQLALRHGVADLVWISDAVHYLDLYARHGRPAGR